MDEMSWRARLAKSNINILDIHDGMVFLEFTYHPKAGVFKWCKTYLEMPEVYDTYAALNEGVLKLGEAEWSRVAQVILERVLALRKELEA